MTHVTAVAGEVVMLMRYLVSCRSFTVVSAPANLMPAHTVIVSAHMPYVPNCVARCMVTTWALHLHLLCRAATCVLGLAAA